jgi:hypothetical protein
LIFYIAERDAAELTFSDRGDVLNLKGSRPIDLDDCRPTKKKSK